MSDRTERIIELIDAGLGSSPEPSYAAVRPDLCTRCVCRVPAVDSDFCGSCRSFLLGDGPEPPRNWLDEVQSDANVWRIDRFDVVEEIPWVVVSPAVSAPRGGIRYVVSPGWSPPSITYVCALRQEAERQARENPDCYATWLVDRRALTTHGWAVLQFESLRALQQHCHSRVPLHVTLTAESLSEDLSMNKVRLLLSWSSADPAFMGQEEPDLVAVNEPGFEIVHWRPQERDYLLPVVPAVSEPSTHIPDASQVEYVCQMLSPIADAWRDLAEAFIRDVLPIFDSLADTLHDDEPLGDPSPDLAEVIRSYGGERPGVDRSSLERYNRMDWVAANQVQRSFPVWPRFDPRTC